MEKLELKHLVPYLPYGLRVKHFKGLELTVTTRLSFPKRISIYNVLKHQINVNGNVVYKPILRPLSDLTKEHYDELFDPKLIRSNCSHKTFDLKGFQEDFDIVNLMYRQFELLFKNHYDCFGLIEKGLAIDINTLN